MDEVYAAVIVPTNEIVETVKIFKQGLESVVGKFPAANADPGIILFAAMADETRAALFTIQLNNFGEFYNNKTVFVDIDESSKQTITAFRKKLSAEIKLSKYDELVDFNVGKTPHITIARGLVEDQYKVARKYFTGRNYTAAFECNCLVWKKLIKTTSSTYYSPIRTFEFANKNLSLF